VLGFKKESSHLLRQITKNEKIPVITKLGSSADKLNPLGKRMLEKDILAATLYNQIVFYKYQRELPDEYTRGVIISN
jgi:dihydroorotate dehydrogenase